jgi:hypothetical protein
MFAGTEENHNPQLGQLATRPKLEPSTSRIRVRTVTARADLLGLQFPSAKSLLNSFVTCLWSTVTSTQQNNQLNRKIIQRFLKQNFIVGSRLSDNLKTLSLCHPNAVQIKGQNKDHISDQAIR